MACEPSSTVAVAKAGGPSDTAGEPEPEDTNPDTDETVTDEATKEAA